MTKGHMLADAIAIIGSLDIVFGEIDRRRGVPTAKRNTAAAITVPVKKKRRRRRS
jgi:hypothetical protein